MVLQIAAAIWVVFEILLMLRLRAAASRRRKGRSGSAAVIWVVIILSMTAANLAQLVPFGRLPGSFPVHATVGAGLVALCIAIRWAAILTLGRFFSVDVAVQEDHRVVRTGLYRRLRHPSYTGLLLGFLGIGVGLGNVTSVLVLLVPITAVIVHRMRLEEAALCDELGDAYREYMQETRRLLPGIY